MAEATFAHIVIRLGSLIIADTLRAVRTLETSHPASFYLPPDNIAPEVLVQVDGSSFCEWKGHARHFDVSGGGERREKAAWSYPDPTAPFEILRDHLAFYAGAMGACFVDGEQVLPQPGGGYDGWITSAIVGPFKGVPGSRFW
ncbi:MAG: DUF427 domain-containing protein [Janthinobacterium lividum]